eukprot:c20421_g1_i1 orf=71-250(+)
MHADNSRSTKAQLLVRDTVCVFIIVEHADCMLTSNLQKSNWAQLQQPGYKTHPKLQQGD